MADNAHARYQREKTKVLPFRLFLNTDQDILDRLDQQTNKAGYIKRLIREDIERNNNQSQENKGRTKNEVHSREHTVY